MRVVPVVPFLTKKMVKKGYYEDEFWVQLEIVKKCSIVLEYNFDGKKVFKTERYLKKVEFVSIVSFLNVFLVKRVLQELVFGFSLGSYMSV